MGVLQGQNSNLEIRSVYIRLSYELDVLESSPRTLFHNVDNIHSSHGSMDIRTGCQLHLVRLPTRPFLLRHA